MTARSPRDELIEAMSIAYVRDEYGWVWSAVNPAFQTNVRKQMRVVLAAIEAHQGGCTVSPNEPTEGMIAVARAAQVDWTSAPVPQIRAAIAASPYAAEKKDAT